MIKKLNFDICFFGTPHGFEQATVQGGFSLDLIRVLEFDISQFDPSLGEKFLRIVERNISGDFYRFISIYTSAQEIDSSRPGGYCGVCLILKNTNSPDPSITIKVLDELLNSLYSIGTNNGKFLFKVQQIFKKIPIPNDFKTLTKNLIQSDTPTYHKIKNNTLLITAGEGLSFPNAAYALSYVCNSYLASKFLDVCIIPSVKLANKIASKSTENIIDLISASKIISNFDQQLLLDYSETKIKNKSLETSLVSAEKAFDNYNQKITTLELQIELLKPTEAKKDLGSEIIKHSNVVTNPSATSAVPNSLKLAPRAEVKSSSNNSTSINSSPTSQKSGPEKLLFGLGVIIFLFTIVLGILAGDQILNEGSFLKNIRKNYFQDATLKKTNIQTQPIQPFLDNGNESDSSAASKDDDAKKLVDGVKAQKGKFQCSYLDQPKSSYLFTPTGNTKAGLTEIAENIALDFCSPLNGCQDQLLQLLKSKNPELIDTQDLKGREVKVDIINDCEIKDQRFKPVTPKQVKKK